MIERIKQFIKDKKYYQGLYSTSDGMLNKKGETLEELFARRDEEIKERVRASYPTITYEEYMKFPTKDQCSAGENHRMDGFPHSNNRIGCVFYREGSELVLYRLIVGKEELDMAKVKLAVVSDAIALGDGAVCKQDYEIVIRAGGCEGRTIMTPTENKVIQRVIRRMNFAPIKIKNVMEKGE